MSNYFAVSKTSNLIINVISSSTSPSDTKAIRFIKTNEKALDCYYKWSNKNPTLCPDAGEILARCLYLLDIVTKGKGLVKPISENLNQRYREPALDTTTFAEFCSQREQLIADYICAHPSCDAGDVADKFLCGPAVARAYLSKYKP